MGNNNDIKSTYGSNPKHHHNRDRHEQQKQVSSADNDPRRPSMTYDKFKSLLCQIREFAVKGLDGNKDLSQQIAQKNNEINIIRDELTAVKESSAKELSALQTEITKLQSELNDKVDLIHYLERQTGDEAAQRVRELQKQVQKLDDEVNTMKEKAVKSIISINGDVGAFTDKFLGKSVYCYPDSDTIILDRENPDEIRLYDLMGVEFPEDKKSLQCIVVQKGWRDPEKVWIEAKLSIAG